MPQTMLAVLAMMLFSLLAMQQQEQVYFAQNPMIRQAVGALFNGAVAERLGKIGSKSCDRALIDSEILPLPHRLAFSPTHFNPGNDPPFDQPIDWAVSKHLDVPGTRRRLCSPA